jgi:hypothetical protein
MTRPSAYELGYDGSMSFYARGPFQITTSAKHTDSFSVSVIKDLPRNITRTFSGRVERRKKRPRDIQVYEKLLRARHVSSY